jgi:hypothetical protein
MGLFTEPSRSPSRRSPPRTHDAAKLRTAREISHVNRLPRSDMPQCLKFAWMEPVRPPGEEDDSLATSRSVTEQGF